MKKLLLTLALFLIGLNSFSQTSKIRYGIQAGLNYANFRGYNIPGEYSALYSESPAFGYTAGFAIQYQIKEKLSLKVELNYERKSQKGDNTVEISENFDDPPQIYNFKTQKNYDYIVIPVMLKYQFADKNSFYVNGGPFIAYLLKSNLTNDLNYQGMDTGDMDTTEYNKKLDFGLSAGLGRNFEISGKGTVYLELRENLGLANTSKEDVWNGGTVKTNSLNLIVGYFFN